MVEVWRVGYLYVVRVRVRLISSSLSMASLLVRTGGILSVLVSD